MNTNVFLKSVIICVLFLGINSFKSDNALQPFTPEMKNQLSDTELKKVQFYLSDELILKREVSNGEVGVSTGEIQIVGGRYFQIIKIKKLTHGVCLNKLPNNTLRVEGKELQLNAEQLQTYFEHRIEVSFDTTSRTIPFSDYSSGMVPGFMVLAREGDKGKTVTDFDGKPFEILKGWKAKLLVKKQEQGTTGKSKEVLNGRTIDK
jgi:hypothetical protein